MEGPVRGLLAGPRFQRAASLHCWAGACQQESRSQPGCGTASSKTTWSKGKQGQGDVSRMLEMRPVDDVVMVDDLVMMSST